MEPQDVLTYLGRFDLNNSFEAGSKVSAVEEITIHEDWNSTSWKFDADIAIVTLTDSTKLSNIMRTVCLPQASFNEVSGIGTVMGWGRSDKSESNDDHELTLAKVKIPAVNASHCYLTFPRLAEHSSNRMFCGGYVDEGKAPCTGDSGGGFYIQDPKRQTWTVKGIVSGSLGSLQDGCDVNKFQLYTNVAWFVTWINKVIEDTKDIIWQFVKFDCFFRRNLERRVLICL